MELSHATRLRIESLLKEKGWNFNELIKRSGVKQGTLSEFKNGRSKTLSIRTTKMIAMGFGMNLSQFFDDNVFK